MKIIHQTAEYTVVCKAAGEDSEHDLPEMLAEQNGDRATDYYVVHRLDQAVAGLLVLARNRVTAAELSRQLTENRLRKTYLCVVPRVPAPASGEMQDLLYKDKLKKKMFPVKRRKLPLHTGYWRHRHRSRSSRWSFRRDASIRSAVSLRRGNCHSSGMESMARGCGVRISRCSAVSFRFMMRRRRRSVPSRQRHRRSFHGRRFPAPPMK